MQTERGWLIGPGDKVLHMDGAGHVTFNASDLTDADLLELAPIAGDRRGTFRPVDRPEFLLGADATRFAPSGNSCLQYYGTTGPRGFYESWDVGVWASGIVTAMVPYIEQGADHGHAWGAASLTWVRKP